MAVELYIEDELIDLIGDEKIQTDYAIAEIGNFGTRNSFRSVDFDIPKTANNCRILENSQIVNNTTLRPYRRLKARVYVDGIDQLIRFADIEQTGDTYNVRVYGGNATFFDILKSKTLTDLSYLINNVHLTTLTNIYDSRTNNLGYIYPLIDWHQDSPFNGINNTNKTFDVRYCFPALFYDELLNEICLDAGYTLTNNIANGIDYQTAKLILPIFGEDLNVYGRNASTTKRVATFENPIYYIFPQYATNEGIEVELETNTWSVDGALTGYPITITDTISKYEIPYDGEYTFRLNGQGTYSTSVVALILKKNGTTLEEVAAIATPGIGTTFDLNLSYTINALAGEVYIPYFISLNTSTLESTNLEIASNVFDFYLLKTKIKQSDIFKNYLQMFCGLIQVNEFNKTVQLDYLDTLRNNIGNAYDWSSKLDYTDIEEMEFELGSYGQTNTLTYKEDDGEIVNGANGEILIDDETIPSTNELFELPYAGTNNVQRLIGISVPKIGIFTTTNDSPPETKITEKREQRILLLERVTGITGSVIYSDGTNILTTDVNLPLAWFIRQDKIYNLGFGNDLINLFYDTLKDIVDQTKIITESIKLNNLDIETLDFLRPVFLDKHNAYFYISKISGFDYGSSESTEVELVKIR